MTTQGQDPRSEPEPELQPATEAGAAAEADPDCEAGPDARAPVRDPPWPDLPLVVAGARLLDAQRRAMRDHLAVAIDGRDPEGVHQMRVASRRLRALLRLLEPLTDGGACRRVERSLRRVARALGRVRELDVLRAALTEMLAAADSADPARALALEAVDARAQRRQRRARAAMIRRFGAVDMDRLDRQLARLATALQARGADFAPVASHFEALDASSTASPPQPSAPSWLREVSAPLPWETHATQSPAARGGNDPIPDVPAFPAAAARDTLRVAAAAAAPALAAVARAALGHPVPDEIGTAAGLTALHEIRIGVKRLRYGIEVAANALEVPGRRRGSGGKSLLRELKALQESLGELHDDAVLADELARGAERAERRGQPRAAAALQTLLAARRRALRRDERRARSELERLTRIDFPSTLELRLTEPAMPPVPATQAQAEPAATPAPTATSPDAEPLSAPLPGSGEPT